MTARKRMLKNLNTSNRTEPLPMIALGVLTGEKQLLLTSPVLQKLRPNIGSVYLGYALVHYTQIYSLIKITKCSCITKGWISRT